MLETLILQEIREKGPISQHRYMELALGHPLYGYYRTQEAISRDFTTAPEISQMFGELIGAWVLDLYQKLGQPKKMTLVEMGPGRGTLMADLLRVTPSLSDVLKINLVEINPLLKEVQQSKIPHAIVVERIEDIPRNSDPIIILANEFFDVLPTRCFVRKENILYERHIGEEEGKLAFTFQSFGKNTGPDQTWEENSGLDVLLEELYSRLVQQKGAFLCIDYGYETGQGDSLQALYKGTPSHPLSHVGSADLTCHVHFGHLKEKAISIGLGTRGPTSQSEFLMNMGLDVRLEMLKHKNPSQRAELELAAMRLTHPLQMGSLFKVLAVVSPSSLNPVGFDTCK